MLSYLKEWGHELKEFFLYFAPDATSFLTGATFGMVLACLMLSVFVKPIILIPILYTFCVLGITWSRLEVKRRNK